MTTIILVIFFLWAFAGLFAFIPFILGILNSFFSSLINLIAFNIYPVGSFVYTICSGLIVFGVFRFLFHAVAKHSS